jgi:hypothetical protein
VKPRRSAALLVALALPVAPHQVIAESVFPSHDVQIEITIGTSQSASVREQYLLTRASGAMAGGGRGGDGIREATFEFLSLPCSVVGPVTASIDGRSTTLVADSQARAPWASLIVPPAFIASPDSGVWRLQYDVRLAGAEPSVPILMPSATLERAEGSRGAAVAIEVTFSGQTGARILTPQLHRTYGEDRWQGRFLAIPSHVRAAAPASGASACDATIGGTAGGLEWRFAIFAGTMAAWVPLYLWWFGRRRWPEAS